MIAPLHLSMWTYPWDVQDAGHDTTARDLGERAGLDAVSLATSYHAGHFLQPRSPRRKSYFPEDGTVYFLPTPARWTDAVIRPKLADIIAQGGDVLGELVRRREAGGLRVSCWTVCLHNTRLGMLHPEAVTRNAFGDPSYFNLCPSHPDARAYVRTLVEDLTRSYRPDVVELESPSFMGFTHGFHHEKDGVGLNPEDDLLLSLCFCPSCLSRAKAAGVDGEAARRTVRQWLVDMAERAVPRPRWPDFPARGIETFRDDPEVYDYLAWRLEPVTSLVAEVREQADPASKIITIDGRTGWLDGCDQAALGKAADGLLLCAYDMSPEETAALIASGRAALGPDKMLVAGFRVFYPEMTGADDLVARATAAVTAGADGLNFYNWGLIPAARLDWVRAAAEAARAVAR